MWGALPTISRAMQMGSDPLLTLKLGEAAEGWMSTAHCRQCKHTREIDLQALVERLGADFPVRGIRQRLRCQCGARDPIIGFVPRAFARRFERRG